MNPVVVQSDQLQSSIFLIKLCMIVLQRHLWLLNSPKCNVNLTEQFTLTKSKEQESFYMSLNQSFPCQRVMLRKCTGVPGVCKGHPEDGKQPSRGQRDSFFFLFFFSPVNGMSFGLTIQPVWQHGKTCKLVRNLLLGGIWEKAQRNLCTGQVFDGASDQTEP